MKIKIDLETQDKMMELYYDCYSIGRIAEKLGLDRLSVMHWVGTLSEDICLAQISVEEAKQWLRDRDHNNRF